MNFSKEQKDYIIHALEHCEVLTGGKSSGKTLELIKQQDKEIERLKEQLNDEIQEELKQSKIMVKKQQEIERLNNIINGVREVISDDDLVVAMKMTNGEEETLLSSKELLLEILQGSDKE